MGGTLTEKICYVVLDGAPNLGLKLRAGNIFSAFCFLKRKPFFDGDASAVVASRDGKICRHIFTILFRFARTSYTTFGWSACPQEFFFLLLLLLLFLHLLLLLLICHPSHPCHPCHPRHPSHPRHLCQDPDSISRTFLEQSVFVIF